MSWQPIYTAPKDGTTIMVCSRRDGISIAYWLYGQDGNGNVDPKFPQYWALVDGCSDMSGLPPPIGYLPTHWMPLPPPPDAEFFGER